MSDVVIKRFAYRHDAEFARNMLEDAGIRCVLIHDDAAGYQAGLAFINQARLIVREEDVAAARDVLGEEEEEE